jgi:TonB family protein
MLWIAAVLACCAILWAAPARAATASCPSVLLIESTNGQYYIAVFEARAPTKVSLDLTLFSKDAVYQVPVHELSIAKPIPARPSTYRSSPAVIKNPGGEELLGATVQPANACSGENIVIPSVASLNSPDRHIDPATDALEGQLATEAASSSNVLVPTTASGVPVPACEDPFDDAAVDQLVKPVFTPEERSDPSLMSIAVRVQIDARGAVTSAAVESSSGSPAVDAIALDAAKQSTYRPARFACQPERSSHVIRVDFSH